MKSFRLVCLLCFSSSLLSLSLSDLPSSCLSDLISPSVGRCCTPHTFIMVEFTLGFGCDVPQFLDGGVRFEVERARQQWEPIRFYSPTFAVNESSLVHFLDDDDRGTIYAQAFDENNTFLFHFVNTSEGPVKIREYLCGEEYANETVRFRWMQRYVPPSVENVSTWWLDDIKISRWDGARLSTIMENNFTNDDLNSYEDYKVRAGVIEPPSCSSSNLALYFRNVSTQNVPRRSLVISHFSLSCSGGNCSPPIPLMQDSNCSVTSCGTESIKCSVGSFQELCSLCPSGFSTMAESPSVSPVACLDENECSLMSHNCSGVAKCVNTFGSFYCSCPPGYTLSSEGNSCLDVDECGDPSLYNCSHSCVNTAGGYNCSCPDGYILNDNVLCTVAVPRVAFDSSDYTVAEGENITLEIILLDDIVQPLTLSVHTDDISAVSGSDYSTLDQSITFQPDGDTNLTVTVRALRDDHAELVEMFIIVLSESSLGLENATVYVTDSNVVQVEFDPTNYTTTEGEQLVFRIVKRTNSSREVTVVFNTHPGTAIAASDYEAVSNLSITFLPGEMEHTVNVSTLDDSILEREKEEFTVSLELAEWGGSGVMLGHSVAMATILDDDKVTVEFSSPVYEVVEGERVEVTVELRGKTDIDVVVIIATQDSTANANKDYTSINKTLTFSSSISTHNISINTINDNILEDKELFQLLLSQPQQANDGVILTDTIATNVTILDNDSLTSLPPVTLGFEQSNYNVSEDDGMFSICVEVKEGQLGDEITINVSNIDIDAEVDQDYLWQPLSPGLTLAPGQTMTCLGNISLIDDDESEAGSPERFQLSLQVPPRTPRGQRVFIDPNTTQVVIFDDDEFLSELENLESLSTRDPNMASDRLSRLVDLLLESGIILSPKASMELLEASQELLQNIGTAGRGSSNRSVGARVLATLDRFALSAYDEKSQPELKIKGLSLRVQEVTSPSAIMVTGIDQDGTVIELPTEAFTRAGQTVRVASFIFSNLSSVLTNQTDDPSTENARIGSPVISTALACGRRGNKCPNNATNGFSMPVRIVLPIMRQENEPEHTNCSFLNITGNMWSQEGCSAVEINDTSVVCECNHLTHFAILLSPNLNITGTNAIALQFIGYVGVSISLVCMVLTIVVLLALKTLWGMRNYIHINLCVCLIIAQLIFVVGVDKTQNQSACSAIAVLLHYWFLAGFMWMLMEGVVLYVALVRVFIKKQRFYIAGFTIVSYGLPLLYMVVTVPLGLVLKDEDGNNYYGSQDACWLRYDTNFIWAFIIPVILIILANIGFFIMAVCIMYKHQRRSMHKSATKKVKHWLKTSIALLFIMGITWIIGVLVFHEALLFVAYIFTIFVAFQGAVIFIMFIVLSKQVRENYKKWWRGKVAESDILSKYFSSSDSGGGKRGLGRFTSLKTSSFRLSRNRSTFRSSNIDSEMKIPDEKPEPPRDTLSPELRMNEYLKKQKYVLGESVTEPSDHLTDEPSTSLKKVTFGDSIAETTELYLPAVNGQANGVAIIVTKGEDVAENGCNHVDANHHEPVSTSEDIVSSSSNKPDQTLVSENNPPQGDSLYNSLDSQQSEDRQNTEQNTSP